MIPEYLLKEEKKQNYAIIALVSLLSTLIGFIAAYKLFPSELDILAVIFAAIPIIYPLTRQLIEDEQNKAPHIPELKSYGSIFLGQLIAFTAISLTNPDIFESQKSIIGAAGYSVEPTATFASILLNNMTVFLAIFLLSITIASAGAFILAWNASVMGVFFATLITNLPNDISLLIGDGETPSPLAFIPHATFEMLGFITAGIAGTLISAALYRKHYDKETWIDFAKLTLLGIALVLIGAILESA